MSFMDFLNINIEYIVDQIAKKIFSDDYGDRVRETGELPGWPFVPDGDKLLCRELSELKLKSGETIKVTTETRLKFSDISIEAAKQIDQLFGTRLAIYLYLLEAEKDDIEPSKRDDRWRKRHIEGWCYYSQTPAADRYLYIVRCVVYVILFHTSFDDLPEGKTKIKEDMSKRSVDPYIQSVIDRAVDSLLEWVSPPPVPGDTRPWARGIFPAR